DLKLPDCVFILTENLLVFDHVNHTIKIVANIMLPSKKGGLSVSAKSRFYNMAVEQIESIHRQLNKPLLTQGLETKTPLRKIKVSSNFTKQEFCKIVSKAKEHIKKGDIIQVVLSQRFQARIRKQPLDIYRRLRSLNPSPYLFFLKLKDFSLVGSSPEMLVRCEDGVVQTMPIAGTRRRGRTEKEDRQLAKELLNDKKERAEHLMLVDLGRNDLGRVSKIGQVKVTEFMRVERYSHVMHLVSEVVGRLDSRFDCYDVLRAAFPAGTVSGSPKIRAMEIVDGLENLRRSTYAGCVGYFSFSGNLDTCITLRTVLIKDNLAYIQAGSGIVADSRPDKEYQESVNKARALVEAISG
ncbi:MAG: chorismate-binding protein, partial [bacterium]